MFLHVGIDAGETVGMQTAWDQPLVHGLPCIRNESLRFTRLQRSINCRWYCWCSHDCVSCTIKARAACYLLKLSALQAGCDLTAEIANQLLERGVLFSRKTL